MNFMMEQMRLSLTEQDMLLCIGCANDDKADIRAELVTADGRTQSLECGLMTRTSPALRQFYAQHQTPASSQLCFSFALPEGWRNARRLTIWEQYPEAADARRVKEVKDAAAVSGERASGSLAERTPEIIGQAGDEASSGDAKRKDEETFQRRKLADMRADGLKGLRGNAADLSVDKLARGGEGMILTGWVASPEPAVLSVRDASGRLISGTQSRHHRSDVSRLYPELPEDENLGFTLSVMAEDLTNSPWTVSCQSESGRALVSQTIDYRVLERMLSDGAAGPGQKQRSLLRKGLSSLLHEGPAAAAKKVWHKLTDKTPEDIYKVWIETYDVTEEELERQRQNPPSERLLSVVVPAYQTNETYLKALIDSLCAQTYPNWELCIADASGEGGSSPLASILDAAAAADPRIRVSYLPENRGIAENTNAAIAMARGELIVFSDHDDVLSSNALWEIAAAYEADPDREAIYSDEDKIDLPGEHRFGPHFKSDFNPDLLRSVNYICHIYAVSRGLLERVGPLDPVFDGAQDYDFALRSTEAAKKVHHIPKILYHWRAHPDSTAENPESKLYAFEAGQRAVDAHYARTKLPARVAQMEFYGTYRSEYSWPGEEPLLSILIPNKDHAEDLSRCVESIEKKSTYRNYEIIIIENNSQEKETFAFYQRLTHDSDRIRVIKYEGSFNFSAVCNAGARAASGEYLLLLNNDTELLAPEGIKAMMDLARRGDVGAVGARLYYPDNTIQHAGVILGVGPYGGFAGHCFVNLPRYEVGYMNRIISCCDYSAVTGACLLTPKTLYDEVGGLDEQFVVALNDIDYCLKIRAKDRLVVYQPAAEWIHYESRSRGYDEKDAAREQRLIGEVHRFQEKWKAVLSAGDPFYNPNLTLEGLDWGLKKPRPRGEKS